MGSEVDQAGLTGDMVSRSGAVGAYTSPFSLGGGGAVMRAEPGVGKLLLPSQAFGHSFVSSELGVTDLLYFDPV